jgi:hypothetical protein
VSTTGERAQIGSGLFLCLRLPEHAAVEEHLGVGAEDQIALDRPRLPQRVLDDDLARVAFGDLVDVGRLDPEVDPELLQDPLPLWRAGSEDEHYRSGKKSFDSRSADSFESEPCTMFCPTSRA